jgi:hypothetical protein
MTQADLASGMVDIGFEWTHHTVSQIESGRRKVTIPELIGLSIIFGETPMFFLTPRGRDVDSTVRLRARSFDIPEWLDVVYRRSTQRPRTPDEVLDALHKRAEEAIREASEVKEMVERIRDDTQEEA